MREEASGADQHRRTPGIVANLQLGMNHFLKFAMDCGALSEREAWKLQEDTWKALGAAARAQYRHQKSEDPVNRFLQLIQSLLASGRVYIQDLESASARNPKGDHVGWLDGGVALLNPDAAFAAAQKLAQEQGEFLSVGQKTLWQRMRDRGLLARSDAERNLVKMTIGKQRRRVLALAPGTLGFGSEDRDHRDS